MKIIFLFPYPLSESPSQRFRFEQYFDKIKEKGIDFSYHSFWNLKGWKILYKPGKYFSKALYFTSGFFKRLFLLVKIPSVDYVFIHRECLPVGPPLLEWIIAKAMRKKIIYDFDDAIWLPDVDYKINKVASFIKWHSKTISISKWSYKVSCGNAYLSEFAKKYTSNVIVNPTTIDTEHLHNPFIKVVTKTKDFITIGWTGSHSTLKYLSLIAPVMQKLEAQYKNLRFMVIANKKPELALRSFIFIPWSKENEIEDLLQIDIGIMPLTDDLWSQGKCGFKALQYMAMGIPTVASPVGVNKEIIDHTVNGFLASTDDEWITTLDKLIQDIDLRKEIGSKAREKVIKHYSKSSNTATFLSLFG